MVLMVKNCLANLNLRVTLTVWWREMKTRTSSQTKVFGLKLKLNVKNNVSHVFTIMYYREFCRGGHVIVVQRYAR